MFVLLLILKPIANICKCLRDLLVLKQESLTDPVPYPHLHTCIYMHKHRLSMKVAKPIQ